MAARGERRGRAPSDCGARGACFGRGSGAAGKPGGWSEGGARGCSGLPQGEAGAELDVARACDARDEDSTAANAGISALSCPASAASSRSVGASCAPGDAGGAAEGGVSDIGEGRGEGGAVAKGVAMAGESGRARGDGVDMGGAGGAAVGGTGRSERRAENDGIWRFGEKWSREV